MKQDALELFRRTGDRRGEAITFSALGYTQWLKGDLAAANESFERSLAIKKEIGDRSGQGFAWFGMSMVLIEQDRLAEAQTAAQQAMAIRQELHDESRGAESKIQLAQIALERSDAPAAERLAREAAEVADHGRVSSVTADCYGVLARALAAQNKFDEARAASGKAVLLAKQSGDLSTQMNAEVASAATLEKKTTDSIRGLKTAQAEAKRNGFVGFDLKARFQLARLNEGNSAAARVRMGALRDEARQKGYVLVAREADAVIKARQAEVAEMARK
jgi:tetratricopeptide (TPR) repeat protein